MSLLLDHAAKLAAQFVFLLNHAANKAAHPVELFSDLCLAEGLDKSWLLQKGIYMLLLQGHGLGHNFIDIVELVLDLEDDIAYLARFDNGSEEF